MSTRLILYFFIWVVV